MFVRMVSISWPCELPALASQIAGITGVSHHARPLFLFFHLLYIFQAFWLVIWSNLRHSPSLKAVIILPIIMLATCFS